MALTQLTKDLNYHQSLSDQPNVNEGLTPAQLKAKFDQAANDIKNYINNTLLTELASVTDGASGADNIGATAITDLDGATVQAILESIRNKLKSITDGASGADFVKATPINTADTVQGILEELKALIDDLQTQITSNDTDIANLQTSKADASSVYTKTELDGGQLDNRYYTESELKSTTDGNSGADKIGATAIDGYTTVQSILENLKSAIDALEAQLPDGQNIPYTTTRIDDLESKYDQSQYSTPVTETSSIIQLPSNTVKGQISVTLDGRTVANLLGEGGNAESLTDFTCTGGTLELDSTKKVYGQYSVKHTTNISSGSTQIQNKPISINNSKYYLCSGYLYAENSANIKYIRILDTDNTVELKSSISTTNVGKWERFGLVLTPTNLVGVNNIRLDAVQTITTTGQILNADGFMINEITEEEYNNLTVDELMQRYNFVNGVKSTFSDSGDNITSVGKNLFDITRTDYTGLGTITATPTVNTDSITWASGSERRYAVQYRVKPNTTYYLSYSGDQVYMQLSKHTQKENLPSGFADYRTGVVSTSTAKVISITTDSDTKYIMVYFSNYNDNTVSKTINNIQLEVGQQTTYEPYQSSTIYPPVLRSLPNGVKDEISEDGKLIQRTGENINIHNATSWTMDAVLTDTVQFYKSLSSLGIDDAYIPPVNDSSIKGFIRDLQVGDVFFKQTYADANFANDEESVAINNIGELRIRIKKSRLSTVDSAGFEQWLQAQGSSTLIYQLATPEITEGAITPLTVFENGTIRVNSTVLPKITWSVPVNTKAQINSNTDGINQLSKAKKDFDEHLAETAQTNDVHGLKTLFQNQQFTNLLKNGDFTSWSAGDTAAPDGWMLEGIGATVSRIAGTYGKNAARVANADTYDEGYIQVKITDTDILKQFSGKTVTFTALVKTSDANRVNLTIYDNDGTGYVSSSSSYHSGSGNYEQLTVTAQLRTGLTILIFRLFITAGSIVTADFERAIAIFGELPVAFTNHPNDQHLKAVDYQDTAGTNYEYGLIAEQNGIATIADTASTQAVTFPKTFKKLLSIQITPITTAEVIIATSGTTTGFTATRSGTAGNNDFYWSAKGVHK